MRRARARSSRAIRRRHGAALIEGLVVSAVTLLFFAGIAFFHELLSRKTEVLKQSRYQAWTATHFECEGRSVVGQNEAQVALPTVMRSSFGGGPATMSARAKTEMACNVEPVAQDTILGALESMGGLFSDLL